jgi:hypothetical protein
VNILTFLVVHTGEMEAVCLEANDADHYFYSRRNLTPRCLARHVLACDFLAALFRRTW